MEGSQLNAAKEMLAYDLKRRFTARKKLKKLRQLQRRSLQAELTLLTSPTTEMEKSAFEGEGMGLVSLIKDLGLVSSNGDGFRTIEQGGLTVNDEKIEDKKTQVTLDMFKDGALLIKKGKKKFHRVVLK